MATSPNATKFLHFRLIGLHGYEPRGGITVAYRTNEDGTISYTAAVCSIRDNFERAVGRALSSLRLDNDHRFTRTSPTPISEREFVKAAEIAHLMKGLV